MAGVPPNHGRKYFPSRSWIRKEQERAEKNGDPIGPHSVLSPGRGRPAAEAARDRSCWKVLQP